MPIPAVLPYGIVSIYGIGSTTGATPIIPPPDFLFGVVEQISPYGVIHTRVYDSVLFPESGVVCRLAYANSAHTLVPEVRLILTEIIPP